MPTVFSILCSYQKEFGERTLSQQEKNILGRGIAYEYNQGKRNTTDLPKVKSYEKEGEFEVVDYPENFVPIIVKLIEDFYSRMRKNKSVTNRPRIRKDRSSNFY